MMHIIHNHLKISIISGVIVFLLLFFIARNLLYSKESKTTKAAPTSASNNNAVSSDIYVVKSQVLQEEIQTTGTIHAFQEVKLVSEIAKKVTSINAREGSYVAKGEVLFRLDDADLQAKKKILLLQENLALLEEKRFRELSVSEAVNQQEYDKVLNNLQLVQAQLEELEVQIAKTRIRAPFDGKLGLKQVDIGSYITPAATLGSIVDVHQVLILFTIPEKYASTVHAGQKINIQTETSTEPVSATILATEAGTDEQTRSLTVKAVAGNKKGLLVPGTSATILFPVRKVISGKIIPTEALIPTSKGYSVFVKKSGVAELREVEAGTRTKSTVHILEGIEDQDSVITTNLIRIAPGVPVTHATIVQ